MFVLSIESQAHINKKLWSTHKILGVFDTREEAVKTAGVPEEDEIILVTDITTGFVERV